MLLSVSVQTSLVSEHHLIAMVLVKHSPKAGVVQVQGLMHHFSVPAQCNLVTAPNLQVEAIASVIPITIGMLSTLHESAPW